MRGENADFLIWYPMTGIFSLGILLMFPVVLYVVLNAGTFGLRRQFRFLALITYNTFVRWREYGWMSCWCLQLFAFFIALWALARDKDDMYTRVLTECTASVVVNSYVLFLSPFRRVMHHTRRNRLHKTSTTTLRHSSPALRAVEW